jgi:hypothetical protein
MRKKKTALPQAKPARRVRRKPPAPEPCITLAD